MRALVNDKFNLEKDYSMIQREEEKATEGSLLRNSRNSKDSNENSLKKSDIPEEQKQLLHINSRALDGWTALHYAVNEGHLEIVRVFLY